MPSQTPCPKPAFGDPLAKAERGSIPALLRLTDKTEQLLRESAAAPACASAIADRYWQAYWKCQRAYDSAHQAAQNDSADEAAAVAAMEKEIHRVGWQREFSESGNFLWADKSWLLKRLGALLPADWQSYLEQQSHQGRLTEDAALQLPWDALRQRVVFWDRFLNQYPDFPERDSVKSDVATYLGMWLGGVDNTPIAEKGVLRKAVRLSYERFLRESPDSTYFPLVQTYYQLLAERKFIPDKVTKKFLDKSKVDDYQRAQPPVY